MTDRHTKAVLTVIAAGLLGIAIEGAAPYAIAQATAPCGDARNPCYVVSVPDRPVYISNTPAAPIFVMQAN